MVFHCMAPPHTITAHRGCKDVACGQISMLYHCDSVCTGCSNYQNWCWRVNSFNIQSNATHRKIYSALWSRPLVALWSTRWYADALRSTLHAHNHCQNILHTLTVCMYVYTHSLFYAQILSTVHWEAESRAHTTLASSIYSKGYLSCFVAMVIPSDGGINCRCMSPPYPLSPTRCWRYRFSYLDSGGDCGLGRCKRPAEARCLPPSQSPRLGSRKLNPLLDLHIQK